MGVITVFAKAVIAHFEGCRQWNVVTVFAEAVTRERYAAKQPWLTGKLPFAAENTAEL